MTTQCLLIDIVIGSTGEDRFGEKPANCIYELAKQCSDLKALKATREAS